MMIMHHSIVKNDHHEMKVDVSDNNNGHKPSKPSGSDIKCS